MTTIGLDIDGVIADFVSEFRSLVKGVYGAELAESDIRAHSLHLALGVSKEEASELVARNLRRELRLYPGAQEGSRHLWMPVRRSISSRRVHATAREQPTSSGG